MIRQHGKFNLEKPYIDYVVLKPDGTTEIHYEDGTIKIQDLLNDKETEKWDSEI